MQTQIPALPGALSPATPPLETFSQAIEGRRCIDALREAHARLEQLKSDLDAIGVEHPDIGRYTDSLRDSLTDAWEDSGAGAFIDGVDQTLVDYDNQS